ncbi:MAG TPA: wax ester/triacylglycerol synthase family O-acyltransferase [Pseudomonadales bacterium]|nr:wax ester/triacylglycerol synthase family O-acyltransferase [Pseudomonadales bacterium]
MDPIRLGLQDATFLHAETDTCPTHVAGLQLFRIPEGRSDFVGDLLEGLLAVPPSPFFRRKLKLGALGAGIAPQWIDDEDFDLDYHVHRIAVPQPGSRAQLERVVERLHARVLDRRRPLWETWFIDGIAADGRPASQFAIYTRIHHSLVDGVAGVALAMAAMSADPAAAATAPWSIPVASPGQRQKTSLGARVRRVTEQWSGMQRLSLEQSLDWLSHALGARRGGDLPFAAPRTSFNARVDRHRRLATRTLSLERVKGVARAAGATLNDAVLAITGDALRHWLDAQDALPRKSLIASCPVSVRTGTGVGNNISMLLADLATDVADPLERLRRVTASTARGKRQIAGLSTAAAETWAVALGITGLLPVMVDGGRVLPPLANLVVSNVPGPRVPMYFGGAEMVGYFPLSIITHGQGLNVTLLSRDGALDFGIVGARSLTGPLGGLADALETALDALEDAVRQDLERRGAALGRDGATSAPATGRGA